MRRTKTEILKDELKEISTSTLREMRVRWLKEQKEKRLASRTWRLKILDSVLINRIDGLSETETTCRDCGIDLEPWNDGYGTESGFCETCNNPPDPSLVMDDEFCRIVKETR